MLAKIPLNTLFRNIAVVVAIFIAARFVVAPHMKHEHATGKLQLSAPLSSAQETAAVRAANAYVQSHTSQDVSKLTPVVTNRNGRIEVTYTQAAGQTGDTPDVIIDSATMTIISAAPSTSRTAQ